MFSEIFKIIPKLENRDLNEMEQSLGNRFSKIAKKFGGGLLSAIKGGGIAGLAIGLIDKVLNPLQQVQEAIEKSLHAGDDLSTFAKQFNTTEGNLSRLQAFGQSTGLDPEGVRLMLGKFQEAVAKAAISPDPTAVTNFVGKKDTAEAFFEFVQSLQKLRAQNADAANLVEQEVFGGRQILKDASFLHADFKELNQTFKSAGVPSSSDQTAAAQYLGKQSENLNTLGAIRTQKDLVAKSHLITGKTVEGLESLDNFQTSRENAGLAKGDSLLKTQLEKEKLFALAADAFLKLAPLIATYLPTIVDTLSTGAKTVEKSRVIRGIVPGQGKDK